MRFKEYYDLYESIPDSDIKDIKIIPNKESIELLKQYRIGGKHKENGISDFREEFPNVDFVLFKIKIPLIFINTIDISSCTQF